MQGSPTTGRQAATAALAVAVGYALGTTPTADIVAKRMADDSIDLRSTGSGNPGGMNALNVLGAKAGGAVMAGDIAKGAVACAVGGVIGGPTGSHLAGTASVIGHCYPAWNGFRGGKGVATSVGQCLTTFPAYFPIDAVVAIGTAAHPRWKRRAFTAVTVSSACWVVAGVAWWRTGWPNLWGPKPTAMLPVAALVSSLTIARRFIEEERTGQPG